MRPDDLQELLHRQPFTPFRIHVTDGATYDIRHPDQVIVLRSRLVLAAGGDGVFPDRLEHVALVHIARIEELPAYASN